MSDKEWDALDPVQSKLRTLVARVELEVSALKLPEPGLRAATEQRLTTAWGSLVEALALGPEPELRSCPHCQRSIASAATRCRYCMKVSPAKAHAAVGHG